MLKFKIHYNGDYEDDVVITGETIGEVRNKAFSEGNKRGWKEEYCWSEEVK
jgi:hypothetical protein